MDMDLSSSRDLDLYAPSLSRIELNPELGNLPSKLCGDVSQALMCFQNEI